TGMIEVELPSLLASHLSQYAQGNSIGFVTANNETQRKITQIYNDRYFDGQMKIVWANTWSEFKEGFLKLQDETDIVLVSNNAGIIDWDEAEATAFFTENTRVPTGSVYAWMAPYTLMVLGVMPKEQGQWAGETALKVLGGTSVSEISITENKRGNLILNLDIAEQLDVVFTPSLLRNAQIYSGSH
ncbi:MAG: ABC transporter substrate-binding protein, partial [Anaerolineae bacterium]|nr:ABC transporter substrate-binding protein [Anaerolineae bacterium]